MTTSNTAATPANLSPQAVDAAQMEAACEEWRAWLGPLNPAVHGPTTPYLLAAISHAGAGSYEVRRTLAFFDGIPIAALDQNTGTVRAGTWSLYVLPRLVYERIATAVLRQCEITAVWAPDPFETPPTENDLRDVFIRAMSKRVDDPPTRDANGGWETNHAWHPGALGDAVRAACDAMGWRNVASVADAACQGGPREAEDVAAILSALNAAPGNARH